MMLFFSVASITAQLSGIIAAR